MSGVRSLVQGVLKLPGAIINGPKSPGAPPVQDDPQDVLADEAIQSSIAGDIAALNAQRQSSTLGSGANFLATSTAAGDGLQDTGPVGFTDQRPVVLSPAKQALEDAKNNLLTNGPAAKAPAGTNRTLGRQLGRINVAGAGRQSLSQRLGR